MTVCLFIGGSADGELRNVDTRRGEIQIPVYDTSLDAMDTVGEITNAESVFTTEFYRREEFREGNNIYFLYASGIPLGRRLETLISGYRKPTKTWKPIETAPWDKTVLLRGDSGYIAPHNVFVINGYRIRGWHQGEWNDMTGTLLTDAGWEPIEWREYD